MRESQEPLFLARRTYRQRRMMDAARLMPWLGIVLFAVPLLWHDAATAQGLLYLFGAWLFLIIVSWGLARGLDLADSWSRGSEDAGDGG
jgi:hypothetical protein